VQTTGIRSLSAAVLLALLCACSGGLDALTLTGRQGPPAELAVLAPWPGADPATVEQQLVIPLEAALVGVAGVTRVASASREGLARIEVDFEPGIEPFAAAFVVREALERVAPSLPADAGATLIEIGRPQRAATLVLAGAPLPQLSERARDLRRTLQRLPGITRVEIRGAVDEHIEVALDGQRLLAHEIAPARVVAAIGRGAGGALDISGSGVRVGVPPRAPVGPDELTRVVVEVGAEGAAVLLGDLATVSLSQRTNGGSARLAGQPVVALDVLCTEPEAALTAIRDAAALAGAELLDPSVDPALRVFHPGSIEQTDRLLAQAAEAARAGVPGARILQLTPAGEGEAGELIIVGQRPGALEAALAFLRATPGVRITRPDTEGRREVELIGPDRHDLDRVAADLAQRLEQIPGVDPVGRQPEGALRPELRIEFNRQATAQLGVSSVDFADALQLVSGQSINLGRGPCIEVRVEGLGSLDDPVALVLLLSGGAGDLMALPLVQVATIERIAAPTSLLRIDGLPAVRLVVDPTGQQKASELESAVLEALAATPFAPGTSARLQPLP
jgi:multidrug efflux pump subunit AcrB